MKSQYIYLAANDSTDEAKSSADIVCSGKNDEFAIQIAVDRCTAENKNLYLYNGIYRIDSFIDCEDNGPHTAVRIPNAHREVKIVGQNHEYGFQKRYDNGVVLYVTSAALESIKDTADVIRGAWTNAGIQNASSLYMENIAVILANNQHPIRCIDLRRTDRVELKNISLVSYGDMMGEPHNMGLHNPPPVPAKGCIGLTMTDGSNYNYSNYTNVHAWGFDEGIQVGGEHVVCINCGATVGRYGFTFGNYEVKHGTNHPITLINCLDERNIHLPLFGKWCGDQVKGARLVGGQEVSFINFNIERLAEKTPGGILGDLMREVVPGAWCGKIEFTTQTAWAQTNRVDFPIWENDGSGVGIRTVNSLHKTVCSSAERLSYAPMLGQQIFDTDLGKMLICIDAQSRRWVDFFGVEA